MNKKPLTKSRFKKALECPDKLYYTGKKEYENIETDDAFLKSLADGGFQVGELAKCYYTNDYNDFHIDEIKERDYEIPLEKTERLLKMDKVVIFEAAFMHENLYIRADVLVKDGNSIKLIEVKSKSYDPNTKESLCTKDGKKIESKWVKYLYDIAFQKYVVMKSLEENFAGTEFSVSAYLMLANKTKTASIDGLNQKFLIQKDGNKKTDVSIKGDVSKDGLGEKVLIEIPVDGYLKIIHESPFEKKRMGGILHGEDFSLSKKNRNTKEAEFEDFIKTVSGYYKNDKRANTPLGKKCKKCEFRFKEGIEYDGTMKSGFEECWTAKAGFGEGDFKKPMVYDVWDYRNSDRKIFEKKYFMEEMEEGDFANDKQTDKRGLSHGERQWLQVKKVKENDNTVFIDKEKLKEELGSWKYPLHFIDFETAQAALPFNKGMSPYEGTAFQFSHHVVHEDGKIEHAGQYINTVPGKFPNFEFIRELKKQLEKDEGTIFMYAKHENTYLNTILTQLEKSEQPDREELTEWIKTIATPTEKNEGKWTPTRKMVDMRKVFLEYYYDPYTGGSNSIKKVLPAILRSSEYLQNKYREPIYGADNGIKSLNLKNHTWIKIENGEVQDPYKILEPFFSKDTDEELNKYFDDNDISDGGAAMTAYAKMQYSEMTDGDRKKITDGLLRYCELDTFAMVMIWEHWNNVVNGNN